MAQVAVAYVRMRSRPLAGAQPKIGLLKRVKDAVFFVVLVPYLGV